MRALKERVTQWELPSGNDVPTIEITQNTNWKMVFGVLLLGMLVAYCAFVIASSNRWKIPGVVTAEVVREVPVTKIVTKKVVTIKEVPVEKVIEKPLYIDRPVEKPVYINRNIQVPVPMQPYRISIDGPRNIPGCFLIFIHLFYGNGDSRNYQATICGRWY